MSNIDEVVAGLRIAQRRCERGEDGAAIEQAIRALEASKADVAKWVPWKPGACHHLDDAALYYTCAADRVTGALHYLWLQPCHWSTYTRAYWSSPLPAPYTTGER